MGSYILVVFHHPWWEMFSPKAWWYLALYLISIQCTSPIKGNTETDVGDHIQVTLPGLFYFIAKACCVYVQAFHREWGSLCFLSVFFSFSIGHGTLTTVTWIGLCLCSETLIKLISYTNWKWASVFESLQQRSCKDKAHSNIYSYLITKHMDMIPSYEDFKNTRECCVGVSDLRSIMFVSIVYSFHCSWHYSSISKLNGLGQNINAVRDTWVGDSREIVQ